jgi:hypothetical protein
VRALTPNETAILKSRFQAGADGHRQQVILTTNLYTASTIENFYYPTLTKLPTGQAAFITRAQPAPYGATPFAIYFVAYQGEHALKAPIELFAYATYCFGLVTWKGQLLAYAWNPATSLIRARVSADNGVNWGAEFTMIAGLPARAYGWGAPGGGGSGGGPPQDTPATRICTNKAGTTLYFFYAEVTAGPVYTSRIMYRSTTDADPATATWSAEVYSGFTVPSVGRNGGGSDRGRAFTGPVETKTPGTWIIGAESDDGDWHANHAAFQGTLGGAWTRKLNRGYGGGLSGGQGYNGGLFLDRNGDVIFYIIQENGTEVASDKSTDSGATWSAEVIETPASPAFGIGGDGLTLLGYSNMEYLWGAGGGDVKVVEVGLPVDVFDLIGVGVVQDNVVTPVSVDVSDRVNGISLQKDDAAAAASFNISLANTDGALNISGIDNAGNPASLAGFSLPNVQVTVYQWHGVVANKEKTFTGIVDNPQENSAAGLIVLVGRDKAKKLLTQRVIPVAPQDFSDGYIRDMENYVYLNKTLDEVLNDLLLKAGLDSSATGRTWAPTTFVFKEFVLSAGSLMDGVNSAVQAAGMRFWFDEDGLARTQALGGPQDDSVWTYDATVDLQTFDGDLSDDNTFTRVRVIGKANIGAKYLAEQFIWAAPAASIRAIAYDTTTGHVWVLCGNSHLYRLDPDANMAVVSDDDLSGWLAYPDSIDVGPDGHLWIADGYNATLTANANRKFRKVDRASPTTTLLGPFTNPDSLHVRLWHDQVNRLYMDTYASPAALVKMNDVTGAEVSRVVSPVNFPMGYDSDGQGGAWLTGWEQTDLFQIDLAGNIVNTVKQPAKNSNELGLDHADLGLYAVFVEPNTIVKYAVAGADTGVLQATYATAIDTNLERQLFGEIRVLDILDLNISDLAMAASTARRTLARVRQYTQRTQAGAIGNPGLQLHDRITVNAPSAGVAAGDYMVRSIRNDQVGPTYLAMLGLEPYSEAY